ncbi:MAG: glycosyltransferase [Bacteroidia bacterium]|nr:glycosyltransferase [Bacteroidia bacterium]
MKVINVITPHFTPEITAAAHRLDAVVSSLSTEYKVNVFTLTERGRKAKSSEAQVSDNVTVYSVNLPRYTKSLFFIRALFEFYYSVKLSRKASRTPADLTFVTTPYMFLLPAAIIFGGKGKKIADVRDLVWCYLPQKNAFQSWIRRSFESLVCKYIRKYDHITVTNDAERNWLLKNAAIDESKITILSNGISSGRFERLNSLKYHCKTSPFVITYVGNIGNGQDLQPLIDAVKPMKDVILNIIGDGIELKKFVNLVRAENLTHIHLHGKLKWSRVLPFYQSSSILFARLGENYQSAIPSKLFEYLSTGLPLVFHGKGTAKNLLDKFENTFILENEKSENLRDVLEYLRNSPLSLSESNRFQIESNYLRENINNGLFPILDGLIGIDGFESVDKKGIPLLLQEDVI